MLTFAISLLFTAGAAFALLVMVGMVVGNRRAIANALAGRGAFAGQHGGVGANPPLMTARVQVGELRRGRRTPPARPAQISPLRAAA